jgi:hypothetical protein
MDSSKKIKAEKLQAKLDKLLQTKEKRQTAFDKTKHELSTVTKEIDTVKLKLFEILQSGSDDSVFSNWAKRKINEKSENGNPVNHDKPIIQNQQSSTGNNQPLHTQQIINRPNNQSQN